MEHAFEENERTRTSLRSTLSGLSHQAESLEQAMKRRGKYNTMQFAGLMFGRVVITILYEPLR